MILTKRGDEREGELHDRDMPDLIKYCKVLIQVG